MIRRMLRWLYDWLGRRLGISTGDPRSFALVDRKTGATRRVTASGWTGLHLVVADGEHGVRLVGREEVADPEEFARVWRQVAGRHRITWADDGRPAKIL